MLVVSFKKMSHTQAPLILGCISKLITSPLMIYNPLPVTGPKVLSVFTLGYVLIPLTETPESFSVLFLVCSGHSISVITNILGNSSLNTHLRGHWWPCFISFSCASTLWWNHCCPKIRPDHLSSCKWKVSILSFNLSCVNCSVKLMILNFS